MTSCSPAQWGLSCDGLCRAWTGAPYWGNPNPPPQTQEPDRLRRVLERRMRWKSHVRCGCGERREPYLCIQGRKLLPIRIKGLESTSPVPYFIWEEGVGNLPNSDELGSPRGVATPWETLFRVDRWGNALAPYFIATWSCIDEPLKSAGRSRSASLPCSVKGRFSRHRLLRAPGMSRRFSSPTGPQAPRMRGFAYRLTSPPPTKHQGGNEINRRSWACLKQSNADHTLPTSGVASVAHSPSGGVQ